MPGLGEAPAETPGWADDSRGGPRRWPDTPRSRAVPTILEAVERQSGEVALRSRAGRASACGPLPGFRSGCRYALFMGCEYSGKLVTVIG